MRITVVNDYEEMSLRAFEIVKSAVVENPRSVLGLATGTTPLGLYRFMAKDRRENGTSYKHVRAFNLDEYVGLDASNAQSYAYFMRKNLFDRIDITLENTYIENGKAPDPEAECARYNALLHAAPRDIQILGIGSNGHIAFNEPGTPFETETHVVELAESTVKDNSRLFSDIADVPRKAYTMGIKNIMRSKKILVLASGAGKANAVFGMVKGEVTEALPASVLQLHPDCILICDRAAAARIAAE